MNENPYAPPDVEKVSARSTGEDPEGVTFDGLTAHGEGPMVFPFCCVTCGSDEPGGKEVSKKLTWSSPWVVALILVNLLVLLIVYLIVRKLVDVNYYLCPACWAKLKKRLWINTMLWVLLLTDGILALMLKSVPLGVALVPLFLMAVIYGMAWGRYPIRVTGYKKPKFALKGYKQAFLDACQGETSVEA